MRTAGRAVIALLAIAVVYALFTLFSGDKPVGSENLIGKPLPDFAAPLAGSGIDGDSNIYTPAQAKQVGAKAACEVRIEGSINSCDGLKGAAVLLFWNTTKSECIEQVARLQSVLKQKPKVNAISLAFDDSMSNVTKAFEQHGWRQPVAVDADGAVATLYSVAGCPSIFYAQNGTIRGVKLGLQTSEQLKEQIGQYTDG